MSFQSAVGRLPFLFFLIPFVKRTSRDRFINPGTYGRSKLKHCTVLKRVLNATGSLIPMRFGFSMINGFGLMVLGAICVVVGDGPDITVVVRQSRRIEA